MPRPRPTTERATARAAAFAVGLGAFAQASRAWAGSPKLQGVGETSVGYTDNAQSAPDVPLPGTTPRSPGAFVLLRPGVVLGAASPRFAQRLKYTYTYDLLLASTDASTSSNQLEYQGFFDLSPRMQMVLGGVAVQSNENSAIVLTPPGAGSVNALPPGSGSFLSAAVNELVSFDLASRWRANEAAAFAEQTPLFDTVAPRTFVPSLRADLERSFDAGTIGPEARAEYSAVQGSLAPDGTALGLQQQVIVAGLALWRRDWGQFLTSRAEVGAMRVQRLTTGRGFWGPAGGVSLAYVPATGDAELSYDHRATTNLFLGETLLVDEVRLRGALPLPGARDFVASASVGYQYAKILDENAQPAAHVGVLLADAGLGWELAPTVLLGLRYQHITQASDTRVPPLPLSFVRNTVLLGATFRFPPDREMPPVYRAPLRVDRTDEIRTPAHLPEGATPGESSGPGP
ncbi:MAG TPA: hypothetical protein VKU41_25985 [Polyangiaceae bacterium]|nr:hypothetical protein [Polyangiaceae bacterium]